MMDPDQIPTYLLPPDGERDPSALMPGAHGPVSDIFRMAALDALQAARGYLDALTDIIRTCPDDDALADTAIKQFSAAQDRAGGALVMFRNSRDAQGQG
ncbi:MAG: hypothetical protein EOO77_16915 [Oxalobacteraceae bacterium]|nr:MAG: hypothetical protein EOO77_16915 [Oxalobacteraceae bacterium]